jgi:hypothetical protein
MSVGPMLGLSEPRRCPGLRHYQSVPRRFWIEQAQSFIKHLLKVYLII